MCDTGDHTGDVAEHVGGGGVAGGDAGGNGGSNSGWQRRLTFDHAVEWQGTGEQHKTYLG